MKLNTTSLILLAAAVGGGYYIYTKRKSSTEAAKKINVEEEQKEEEAPEEQKSYGTPSGTYGTQSFAPAVTTTTTSQPQKLTAIKKIVKGKKFTDVVKSSAAKYSAYRKMIKAKKAKKRAIKGFDNCIGLF